MMILHYTRLFKDDTASISKMSQLAKAIVKEHFDPIIGSEQNDYMIQLFQTEESISGQLQHGYEYYFVQADGRNIGFLAFYDKDNDMYLSKFYLQKQYRGQGYARQMLQFLIRQAKERDFNTITLNVNRNNSAVLAYDRMGFEIIREEKNDIGQGYVMDDYVMQYRIEKA